MVCSGWAGDAVVRTVIFPSVYNSRGASVAVGHRLRDRSCGFYCGQRPQVRKQHEVPRNRDGLQRHRARSRRKQERGVFDGQGPGPHSSGGRHVAVGLVEGTPSTASPPGGKPAALRLLPLAEDEPPPPPYPPAPRLWDPPQGQPGRRASLPRARAGGAHSQSSGPGDPPVLQVEPGSQILRHQLSGASVKNRHPEGRDGRSWK